MAQPVWAATYFEDNFDNYSSLSDVSSVGGWSYNSPTQWAYSSTGGRNNTPCIVVHANVDSGTSVYAMLHDPNSAGSLAEGYIRLYYRIVDHDGSSIGTKFLKLNGEGIGGPSYANFTCQFNTNSVVTGNGSGLQNDNACGWPWYNGSHICTYSTLDHSASAPSNRTDGNWHYFEIYFKENTNDNYDGEIQVWFDGVSYMHATGIKMRHNDNVRNIEAINLFAYAYMSVNDDSNDDYYVYYDDVVVSDSYIGAADVSSPPTTTGSNYSGGTMR
jgi:hypothetical protein